MDAKEVIGRAVAKMKGKCWHDSQLCELPGGCPVCGENPVIPGGLINYCTEERIREAVRVLCDTNQRKFGFVHRLEKGLVLPCDDYTPSYLGEIEFLIITAPAEVLVEALLPIAEEVLKGESDEKLYCVYCGEVHEVETMEFMGITITTCPQVPYESGKATLIALEKKKEEE